MTAEAKSERCYIENENLVERNSTYDYHLTSSKQLCSYIQDKSNNI